MSLPDNVNQAIQLFLQAQQHNQGERKEIKNISETKKQAENILIDYIERSGKTYLAIGEGTQRQFFTVVTEHKKEAVTEEFLREAFIAFLKRRGVENTQAQQQGQEFYEFVKSIREHAAVVKKRLQLRKNIPQSALFEMADRL